MELDRVVASRTRARWAARQRRTVGGFVRVENGKIVRKRPMLREIEAVALQQDGPMMFDGVEADK